MEHELKIYPEYFQAMQSGIKSFELRKDDRPFAVGDTLLLREFNPVSSAYTGAAIRVLVTYVLRGEPWLSAGFVALSVRALLFGEGDPTFFCESCWRETHIRQNGLCFACATEEAKQ